MDKKLKKKKSSKDEEETYQMKYEFVEEKYSRLKDLVKTAFEDLKEEKENVQLLKKQCDQLSNEVKEKDELLEELASASEDIVYDYKYLQTKYDLEMESSNSAIKRASKLYEENQILKRNAVIYKDPPNVLQLEITNTDKNSDENISEIDMLHKTTSELRSEVACLKTQLEKELERKKDLVEELEVASALFEEELLKHENTKEKLELLIDSTKEQFPATSEDHSPAVDIADASHMGKLQKKMMVLNENMAANRDSGCKHLDLTEKLVAWERKNTELQHRIQELESEMQKIESGIQSVHVVPPPPPLPPPQPPSFNPFKSLMSIVNAGKKTHQKEKEVSVEATNHHRMLTEMMDAMKKGKVHLRPTPKKAVPLSVTKSRDSAVGELQSILRTVKKKTTARGSTSLKRSIELLDDTKGLHSKEQLSLSDANLDELQVVFRKKNLASLPYIDNSSLTTPSSCDKIKDVNESFSNLAIGNATGEDERQGSKTRSLFEGTTHKNSDVKKKFGNTL